jgi:hypothetical protein
VQRHGKAVEPFLMDGEKADGLKVFTPVEEGKDALKSKEFKKKMQELEKKAAAEEDEDEAEAADSRLSSAAPLSEETQAATRLPGDSTIGSTTREKETKQKGKQEDITPRQQAAANTVDPLAPLETVLQMPPPESQDDSSKPPHLQPPPYVHHFDTYTLVQQVEKGGFTTEQAITAMKAVRGLLALNLDVAKAGLVSKYDVENVSLGTYWEIHFEAYKFHRKRIYSVLHAQNSRPRYRTNGKKMTKPCAGSGHYCNTKSTS